MHGYTAKERLGREKTGNKWKKLTKNGGERSEELVQGEKIGNREDLK